MMFPPVPAPRGSRALLWAAFLLLATFARPVSAQPPPPPGKAPAPPAVELRLAGDANVDAPEDAPPAAGEPTLIPSPTASFELRFAEAVVAPAQIGTAPPESPLGFEPPLRGVFRWVSARSGVWTPAEPFALDTLYRPRLRPGLRRADGRPLAPDNALAEAAFRTPGFQATGYNPAAYTVKNAGPEPRVQLLFNAAVDPAAARRFVTFQNAAGERVAANVQPPGDRDYFPSAGPRDAPGRLTWRQRFTTPEAAPAPEADDPDPAPRTPKAPGPAPAFPNRLVVTPARPLDPGQGWKLVAAAGLPAADQPGLHLPAAREVEVGDVLPFRVAEATAAPGADHGRRVSVTFSKSLPVNTDDAMLTRFLRVSPAPGDLQITVDDATVELRGDFRLDTDYALSVDAGLPAAGPFKLAEPFRKTLRFAPAPPRLALPDFTTHQLAGGSRRFTLWALNAPEIRLRAKRFSADQAPRALLAYEKEYYANADREEGLFDRVNLDALPGEPLPEHQLDGPRELDRSARVDVNWTELLGPGRHTGIVLVEAEQPAPNPAAGAVKRAGVQALVQITDLGVISKSVLGTGTKRSVLVHVFSLADARPTAAARVRLLDAGGRALAEAQTGPDGVARLPDSEQAGWLVAERGEDAHVIKFGPDDRDGLPMDRFRLPDGSLGGANAADDGRQAFLFSERGVYQPGETAHLKLVVRDPGARGELLPPAAARRAVTLRAFDARGRKFWERQTRLGAAGSLAEDLAIPPAAALGRYRVEARFEAPANAKPGGADEAADGGEGGDEGGDEDVPTPGTCAFQVQEYRPNAFDVRLGADPAYPAARVEGLQIPLSARYLMGKTLSRAKVSWSLQAHDETFKPAGFDDYLFNTENVDSRLGRRSGSATLQGTGALDARGELLLAPAVPPNPRAPAPRVANLLAEVTDLNQQTVSGRARFTLHASEFYLGMKRLPEVVREGEPLPVELVAVRAADGQPFPGPVRATVKLTRVEWRTARVQTAGGGSGFDNEPHLEPVAQAEVGTVGVHAAGPRWEPDAAPGNNAPPAAPTFVPSQPGSYLLEATARDAAGREVVSATEIHVYGKTEAPWGFRSPSLVEVLPDRAEYLAGDTATLLLKTNMSGRALVTVEREGVLRTFSAPVDKASPTLQIPVLPGDAPNVFVSVVLLRGADASPKRLKSPEYRVGYCQLAVGKPEARLAVSVRPARPELLPGEEVAVDVEVADKNNRPVPNAEVTLYAVDEGVLALTGYQTPDPLGTFFRPRPLSVRTGLTLPTLHAEDPAESEGFENKGYLVGGGGENGDANARLRQNFLACAYWNAALRTDARGRVGARFPAPDGLTQYRLMAVVHAGGEGFGHGAGGFRVRKPLMLEPALPRFGNVGDKLLLRAVLHNDSPVAGEAEVRLDLDDTVAAPPGGDPAAPRVRRVPLAAGETRAVDFPVEFVKTGRAGWTWRARLAGGEGQPGGGATPAALQDATKVSLNVGHPTPRRQEILAFKVSGERLDDLLNRANPEILEGEDGRLEVSVSNSRLGELREGVDALLHYPYGCVEQTVSSLLPWLALKDFANALPELRQPPARTAEAVARAMNRLVSMQTESGGLAYWPAGKEPHLWGSAYGTLGMVLARRAGFPVPEDTFGKVCDYLAKELRAKPEKKDVVHPATDRCLALYALALAGRPEAGFHETWFQDRARLSAEDRALLALAVSESRGPAEMADTLLREAVATAADDDEAGSWSPFANEASVAGMRLLAWCRHRPADRAVEGLVRTLLETRRNGGWSTTQGNAWALLGMAAYARETERDAGPAAGSVVVAGEAGGVANRQAFRFAGRAETFSANFPLTARTPLAVLNPGKRPLFVQVKISSRPRAGARSPAPPPPGRDAGYSLQRRYEKVADDNSLAPAENLRVGDRVLVSLQVNVPRRANYLVVDDPLPANLEAVNPDFVTQATAADRTGGFSSWVSSFRELREDRALFFCDRLRPGTYRLSYLARVRAAGTATAPAAKVEEMYHPERFGLTPAGTLASTPLE